MAAMSGDEPVEEVDEHGSVLRVVSRRDMRAGRLRHRSVFIAVQSRAGRLLVHQRSHDKDIWPGWWDIAVGGVVGAGEDWHDAARREVAEEIGVQADPIVLGDGGLARYDDDQVSLVARVYRVVHDGPFTFADGEVVAARWVDRRGLDELLAAERVLPDSLAIVLPLLDVAN